MLGIEGISKGFLTDIFDIGRQASSGREGVSPSRDSDYRTFCQLVQFIQKLQEASGNIALVNSRRVRWETRS